jgi:PST family polysaccharide transporter
MDECCRSKKTESLNIPLKGALQSATISGLGWSCVSQLLQMVLQFIVIAILAHILNPEDFGTIAKITIFTGFLRTMGELGFNTALVQCQDVDRRHLDTVFWLTSVSGVLLTFLTVLLAPFIASFYEQPLLKSLMITLSFTFFITSLSTVHQAILQKGLKFQQIAKVEIGATFLAGICAVGFACNGAGLWSLVVQTLVGACTLTFLLWHLCRWRPDFSFDHAAYRQMHRFSMNLLGFNGFNYLIRNFDNLLIGKFLGSTMLGIYSFAYNLMILPVSQITSITSRVMFSALSSIKDDIERVRGIFLMSTRIIALLAFPVIVGMFIVAEPFVSLVYGDMWLPVVPVFKVLCISGLLQPIGASFGWIFTSQGRTDLMLKFGVYSGIIYLISFIIGLQWGILGVAWSYVISGYVFIWYPAWTIPCRLIDLKFSQMLSNLYAPFFASISMGGMVCGIDRIFTSKWSPGFRCITSILLGVLIYTAILCIFRLRAYLEAKNFILVLRRQIFTTDY